MNPNSLTFVFGRTTSILLLIVFGFTSVAAAQKLNVDELQATVFATIEKVSPAVVSINGGGSLFSGVIVSSNGHVLTAGHTIRPGRTYQVNLSDGRRFAARSYGSSESLDCGLLKIVNQSDLPFALIGNSSNLVTYQPCLSLSYPGGWGNNREAVVRFGYISRPGNNESMIQSTALMEPGDSGGPLFDLSGKVIAIHSRIGRSMDRNYDVPVNRFKKYWDQLNQPEMFSANSGPALPKFGFEGEESREGIKVVKLVEGEIAEKIGFKTGDMVVKIQGNKVNSLRRLRSEMRSAFESGKNELAVTLVRDDEAIVIDVPFDLKKPEPSTPAERIPGLDSTANTPRSPMIELAKFPAFLSELESRLDDSCTIITSKIGTKSKSILATKLAGSSFLISKSSMVGDEPVSIAGGKSEALQVVARDSANDLVLLRSSVSNSTGIKLGSSKNNTALRGRFLLTPDPNGAGFVSVWSTSEFVSPKQKSKGYLGVVPVSNEGGGVILERVDNGAAKRAGLKIGDVIVQLNETEIKTRPDIFRFLAKLDPNMKVTATVIRDDEEFTKEIVLGAPPENSNHAADMMEKSERRDGFTAVFSHDANLKPEECGGPLFDLKGNFVGINMARNSRVRSFAIPPDVIESFVNQHVK